MEKNTLPVISIFLTAISLPYKHYRLLLKVGLPLIITGSCFYLASIYVLDIHKSAGHVVVSILMFIAIIVSLVMAVVGCHRIFLMGPVAVEDSKLFNWTGNEIKYIGWSVVIALCASLIAIPFMLFVVPFLSSSTISFSGNGSLIFIVMTLLNIPIYYFVSRWSMVLPSCAIDMHGKDLGWSWRLSTGNGWRLTVLIGVLPLTTDMILNVIPMYDSIFYSLIFIAVWLVVGVIEVGMLSLSYAFLVSEEEKTPVKDTYEIQSS